MSGEYFQANVDRLVATARRVTCGGSWTLDDFLTLRAAVEVFSDAPPVMPLTIAGAWKLVKGAAEVAGGLDFSIEVVEKAIDSLNTTSDPVEAMPPMGEKWSSGHVRRVCCDRAMAEHGNRYPVWQDPEKEPE